MRTFLFFIVLLFFSSSVISTVSAHETPTTTPATPSTQQPSTPSKKGRGRRRRNAAKFFGFVRANRTMYLYNQTELAKEFMHAHNWVRKEYKLPPLAWSENLASFARKYLMERYDDCKLVHSTANYGENMFWGKKLHWTPSDAVYYWYKEKDSFDFNTLKCAPPPKLCEHFTQIVWRDSSHVGCALQHCKNVGTGMLIACEYDPPGNFVNENPLVHTT
ncbi:pathogenesis-related protein PRB1-3-like [Vicia villosa]|uniref:pathogenesis-related protein PRB1-3-like n=1 Tax=Vicia villosa TaxID=3911 RepID=UPI00273B0EC6|nr:pathogenesis-related protein PRB1-3-like [Vicia villosa]